jgi:FtsZ-interacting cell division protein YlmF
MSEYQYYEFQAIDRPLTEKEMGELRSYSTRARITATSFVNDYSWGSFKGNADAWMEKYFDAFLYLANWGTHILKLRLPSRLLDLKTARLYCTGKEAIAKEKNGKVILNFISEDEGGGEWVDPEGLLSSLISVRAEIARGDLRGLYLGWLLSMQNRELDGEDVEPPVPPGLGQLKASLESLAEFLRIDPNLIHVAARASQPMEDTNPKKEEIREWMGKLPAGEKDDMLASFVAGEDVALATELLRRFIKERRPGDQQIAEKSRRRTVGELLRAAEEHAEEQRRLAAKKAVEKKARRDREAAVSREKYFQEIAGREPELWNQVEDLIATKQPKSYDHAVKLLLDLRDLAARKGKRDDFEARLDGLRAAHPRKPSLINRLRRAGL